MAAYSIPEMNMENLEKKLARIRNKAEKYGCDFKYERTGEHFGRIPTDEYDSNGKRVYETIKYIDIDVEGSAVVNGWQYAATLEYTDKGNLISGVPGIEIPARYYTCRPWCEHCKTQRDRKSSYIVYKAETGEFKQVGRGCLKDFTCGMSAEGVAMYESWLHECEEASEFTGMGCWTVRYYDTIDFMAAAAETIRIYGYAKYNRESPTICTASLATDLYRAWACLPLGLARDSILAKYDDAVSKGFDPSRSESKELAKVVREWVVTNEQDNNYFHNLKVACAADHVTSSMTGLLVSAFPAYDRELEYQAEKAERERKERDAAAKSTWLGEVGDRVMITIADVDVITSWETQWGTTWVYKITDESGHVCTWKTSGYLDDEDNIGKVLKGTVKELKEFRGVKQTELTRCRIA